MVKIGNREKFVKALSKRNILLASTLIIGFAISGCTVDRQIRGYIMDTNETSAVTPGFDNMSSVVNLLGNPSMRGTFTDDVWYYINEHARRRSLFKASATERTIMAIYFDEVGLVAEIKTITLADAIKVKPRHDKTPTRGRKLGFFEQIFGNVGRFSGNPGQ
jgi:outer membrane protein assembly factor BamE (lipoprotein component of BamABCDE complex)